MKIIAEAWEVYRQLAAKSTLELEFGETMEQNFRMIDVGEKPITRRRALARGEIKVHSKTMEMIRSGQSPKGNILAMAEVAGILGAKNTPQNLPLCHHLIIDSVRIWFELSVQTVTAFCEVICHGKTGVEMEALVGVNICLLTIYDLAKAVDPVIEISNVYLDTKEGGKSGLWRHPKSLEGVVSQKQDIKKSYSGLTAHVITLSDRASQGVYPDEAGPILQEYFAARGAFCDEILVIPDEIKRLQSEITKACAAGVNVVALTGGTGISARDITPEAVREIADRELVGFGELQRQHGAKYTQNSWLSRSTAFVIGRTLVVLLPGSPKAVTQGLEVIGELVPHAIKMIEGKPHSNNHPSNHLQGGAHDLVP